MLAEEVVVGSFLSVEACVCFGSHFTKCVNGDVRWKDSVEPIGSLFRVQFLFRVKVCSHFFCVHPCVCSSGSGDGNGLSEQETECFIDFLLHTDGVGLHLPAVIGCAVIGKEEEIAMHGRGGSTFDLSLKKKSVLLLDGRQHAKVFNIVRNEVLSFSSFSNHGEGDFNGNFFVEFHGCAVGAHFFHFFHHDALAIHFEAEFSECFRDVEAVDGAVDSTGCTDFRSDGDGFDGAEFCCEFFSVSLDFGELVSALLEVLSEYFLCGGRSDDCFALGDEVVAAIAVLNLYDIVFVSESGYVFFKNQFHNVNVSS